MSNSVAAQYKAWFCGHFLAGITGSNPTVGHGCLSVLIVVYCKIEVSATGRSLVQRRRTACDVSECDIETCTMRTPGPFGLPRHEISRKENFMIQNTHQHFFSHL